MSQNKHPWVEDFRDFEAVLVCTNTLPTWDDPGSIIRAFQTNLWNQTAQRNEQQYSHSETGVIIRHDVNVVAIEFGHELPDAFADLFRTLHSLGWEHADVYHPAETMDIVLMEMGRAIPANMGFDVSPAKMGVEIGMTNEGRNILAQSVQDLGGAVDRQSLSDSSDVIDSMFAAVDSRVKVNQTSPTPLKNPVIRLDDDEPLIPSDTVELNIQTGRTAPYAYVPSETDEPFVFDVGGQVGVVESFEPGLPTTLPSPSDVVTAEVVAEPLVTSVNAIEESVIDANIHHSIPESKVIEKPAALRAGLLDEAGVGGSSAQAETTVRTMPVESLPRNVRSVRDDVSRSEMTIRSLFPLVDAVEFQQLVQVGKSAFCFDFPSRPIPSDEFEGFVVGCGFELNEVVRLYPGELNEPLRWDLMDEFSVDSPWFFEKLAGLMFPSCNTTLTASILLAMKKDREFSQLRDLLRFVRNEHELVGVVETVMPEVADCFATGVWSGELKQTMDDVAFALGGLLLPPAGSAFVDVLDGHNENSPYGLFSVKSIINSDTKQLYVVHVDEMDGPFVLWLAQLLMCVTFSYSRARRRERVAAEVVEVAPVAQPVVSSDNLAAAKMLAEMVKQFQAMGIELPK